MKRKDKITILLAVPISLAIIAITSWGIVQRWGVKEQTVEIWLPERYQIVNKIGDTYTLISTVQLSGTVIYIPLEDYKFLFNKANVAITNKGEIYYWTKEENITFVAVSSLTDGLPVSSIRILNDKTVELTDEDGIIGIGMLGVIVWALSIVGSRAIAAKVVNREKDC